MPNETTPATDAPAAAIDNGDDAQRAELAGMFAADEERGNARVDVDGDGVDGVPPNAEAAAEAQGDADQAESKDPPKPEPEKPNESKLFKSALALRDEANGKFEETRRERAVLESERSRFEADRTAFEAERAKLANIRRDPMSAFELLGFTPAELGKWLIEDDEQRAQRLRGEEANESRSKVDDETKRELAELKAWKEKQETERIERAAGMARSQFVDFVAGSPDKYPDLDGEDPEELSAVMWDLAKEHHRNTGQVASFEALATHMQNAAADKRLRREERRRGRSTQPASGQSSESQATQRQQGQPASPGPRSAPTTLSNGAATERASTPRELTKEELDRECAKELAGLWG